MSRNSSFAACQNKPAFQIHVYPIHAKTMDHVRHTEVVGYNVNVQKVMSDYDASFKASISISPSFQNIIFYYELV